MENEELLKQILTELQIISDRLYDIHETMETSQRQSDTMMYYLKEIHEHTLNIRWGRIGKKGI